MSIECYRAHCRFHSCHQSDDGPFCDETECRWSEHIELKIKETAKQFNAKCEDCATLTEIIHCMIEKILEDEIRILKEENDNLKETLREVYHLLDESRTKRVLSKIQSMVKIQ